MITQFFKLHFNDFVIPLLAAAILLPPIRFNGVLPDIRFEVIIIVAAWVLVFLPFLSSGGLTTIKLLRIPASKWFFLFALCILISIVYAALFNNFYPSGSDLWEFGKLLLYFLIFFFVANLRISPDELKKYYVASLIIFILSALVGIAQHFNFCDINSTVSPLYATTQLETLTYGGRVVGTMANPNEFASLMVLSASISLAGALWLQERRILVLSWIAFCLSCLAIVLTGSRSGLVALALTFFIITILLHTICFGSGSTIRLILIISTILLLIFVIIISIAQVHFFSSVASIQNMNTDISWQVRQVSWPDQLRLWSQSPIFGWGPGKSGMPAFIDSEWILLLRRYGILGVLVFIMLFTSIFIVLAKLTQKSARSYLNIFCYSLQAVMLAYIVIMIPGAVYHDIQLMCILFVFLGIVFSQRYSISNRYQT
jgi:O-antigen ligase